MGLFSKPEPAPAPEWNLHETDQGDVLTPPGVAPRPRQADPGGQETLYRVLGRNDPELGFITPPGMRIICERGEFGIGDELWLTQAEYQVISKNSVLVPVDAL